MTSEELKDVTNSIFQDNAKRNELGLKSDRSVQNRFAKSYKTRYFLELIQNARDAIFSRAISDGRIKAWVADNVFYFANNGAAFTADGIQSICYPAISTKEDKDMIGHKGIGFNAVLEITDQPEIITEAGSVLFSTEETGLLLNKKSEDLPLFQFPIFRVDSIGVLYPELYTEGFTTLFKMPLTKKVVPTDVITQAMTISGQDIIFLSSIAGLQIAQHSKKIVSKSPLIELVSDHIPSYFKEYHHSFEFSDSTISQFEEDEQEQFKKDKKAECRFLLQTDVNVVFKPAADARLYLYYAMDLVTGFSFSIHSFFSVTIDRKRLSEKSILNRELFRHITDYLTGEFLNVIKDAFPSQVLEILCYQRQANSHLEPLYDALKTSLPGQAFIFHRTAKSFLKPGELLIVTKEEDELFDDGMLGDKYLLYVKDQKIQTWLINECGAKRLDRAFILQHIETKCQVKAGIPEFFDKLYKQNQTWGIDLSAKKILLTQHRNLVAGEKAEVYYQRNAGFLTPAVLEARMAFLHPGIKVQDIREHAAKQLGLRAYNEDQLLGAALRLFVETFATDDHLDSTALEIIRFVKRLQITKPDSLASISRVLHFPVIHKNTGEKKWLNLLENAVYFENFLFAGNYNNNFYYVDQAQLGAGSSEDEWREFLSSSGVWQIPGAYILAERQLSIAEPDKYIENDRQFHIPAGSVTPDFARCIITHWPDYHEFIVGNYISFSPMRVQGGHTTTDSGKIFHSGLVNYLKRNRWIPVQHNNEMTWNEPSSVFAMSASDFYKTQNQVMFDFIRIIQLDGDSSGAFIADFDIIHFSGNTIENYRRLLRRIAEQLPELEKIVDKNSFEKFFNRILTYLHDCLNALGAKDTDVNLFRNSLFLCRSLVDGSLQWARGEEIIHVDQKAFLDQLNEMQMTANIPHPYSFTKKDRNEWGKYAQRIGRQLSKIVKTRIISDGVPCGMTTLIMYPEVIVAFVEDDQDKNLSVQEIEALRGLIFRKHQALKIEMNIDGQPFELDQPYYVEGEKDKTILHLDESLFSWEKTLSKGLSEYFEHFTDSEMKRLDLIIDDIQQLSSKKGKYNYALKREIDLPRLEEIGLILETGTIVGPPADGPGTGSEIGGSGTTIAKVAYQTILEPKEVKEITLTGGVAGRLEALDTVLDRPVALFDKLPSEMPSSLNHRGMSSRSFNSTHRELSKDSKINLGFLGEYYVYRMIVEHKPAILAKLDIDASAADQLEWFNEHRVNDLSLPDRSTGKGCDMQIEELHVCIEVKAMSEVSDILTITYNELRKMREIGDHYYLIIVKHVLDETRIEPLVVRNPYREIINSNLQFIELKLNSPS